MPICEADPWRMQYFKDVSCPAEVRIPTEDFDAYEWNPAHHWVYNKLLIAESQGLTCAPHGVTPRSFPVFSKPLINLRGMGAGSRVLASLEDYERHESGGHFWMTLLKGEHVSSDIALRDGAAVWFRHARGIPSGAGTFDYWIVDAAPYVGLERYCGAWLARHLAGYTGMVNLESIGGRIIEVHLRFSDQWPDLYGRGWLDALVGLYARGEWKFTAVDARTGYSVVLFGPHGIEYRHPPAERVQELIRTPGVTSIQITFHAYRAAASHAMPPGGFRLAVVNCWDLEAGRRVRAKLAALFGLRRDALAS
ncbi:MAG TPA: hypothetical protein VK820_09030 [Steroidobacteraceae bacterium]|jgi:hypothetical protein|nr:hypothetical protein [Steroidobacteraceae bacterium]